ncbi:MAG: YafY family protein [Planctomycetota bacterium]
MRRADRLFQIVQLLRGRRVVTASELAQELEVSLRTIYRDVADLLASGVPIEGEAGVGYCLPRGFDLPPLMFDEDELEALVLGARMVEAWADRALARRARSMLAKIEAVLPERLRPRLERVELFAPSFHVDEGMKASLEAFRRATDARRKLRFAYTDKSGAASERTVRPLALVFWGSAWTATGWCELRSDFRSFSPERMREVEVLDEVFEQEAGKDWPAFLARIEAEHGG